MILVDAQKADISILFLIHYKVKKRTSITYHPSQFINNNNEASVKSMIVYDNNSIIYNICKLFINDFLYLSYLMNLIIYTWLYKDSVFISLSDRVEGLFIALSYFLK